MNIQKRTSKKGVVSYLIRISLGYKNGKQTIKSMTYKPPAGMSRKAMEREAYRQAVLFEEREKKACEQSDDEEDEDETQYAKSHTTFRELAEEWLELQRISGEMKPSSLIKLQSCKKRTFDAIGDVLVSKLTYRKVQSFITSLAAKGMNQKTGEGLSKKTQQHYLTFISDVLLYAKRCGIIDVIPCRDITFTRSVPKEKEVYTLEEARQLLAVIDEKAPVCYRLFFNLLAYCGMRKGEALGIEYKDIDFETSVLRIRRTSNYQAGYGIYADTPKTKSSYRSLYLQPKLIDLIKKLKEEQAEQARLCGDLWHPSDRLFTNWNGKALNPGMPYKWLRRFCEDENLVFKGLHSFRHFVATQALANGVDAKAVSSLLGHSQTSTTLNIYAHVVQKSNEKALNSVAGLLEKPNNEHNNEHGGF